MGVTGFDEDAVCLLDPEKSNSIQKPTVSSRIVKVAKSYILITIQILLLFFNIAALSARYWKPTSQQNTREALQYYSEYLVQHILGRVQLTECLPAPIHEAVEWETQHFEVDIGHTTAYSGPPSYERDLAWHLFENSNLRITSEELSYMNKTSIALAYGNGFMGNLGMREQLHL